MAVHAAAVCQGSEAESPVVAKLSEARGLEVLSLGLSSFEACGAMVSGVKAVAPALDRPDRKAVRRSEWAGLCWKGHVAFVG